MAQIPPIDDAYINEIIKSNGPYNPSLITTQGTKMRELIKLLRDRMEQGDTEAVKTTGDQSILGTKTFTLVKAEGISVNNLTNPALNTVISPVNGVQTKLLNLNEGSFAVQLAASGLSALRSQTLQDKSGVIALISDVRDDRFNPIAGTGISLNGTYPDITINTTGIDSTPDATTLIRGKVRLSGDLAGNADAPTVPGLALKIDSSQLGIPGGIPTLDSGGKVLTSQLPDSIVGALTYQGVWNAATNTPALTNPPASSTKGYYYVANTAGTQFGITVAVGDWIVSNGTAWEKVDNSDAVTSVFGRLGNILANEGDYSSFYPLLSGSYADPSWITSLAYSKLTGVPTPTVSSLQSVTEVGNSTTEGIVITDGVGTSYTMTIRPDGDGLIRGIWHDANTTAANPNIEFNSTYTNLLRPRTTPAPIAGTDLTNKTYVDNRTWQQVTTAGNVTNRSLYVMGNGGVNPSLMYGIDMSYDSSISTSRINFKENATSSYIEFNGASLNLDNGSYITIQPETSGTAGILTGSRMTGSPAINPGEFVTLSQLPNLTGYELLTNKQNSLATDGTNTKYPTVTAVNTGLALKQDHLNGTGFVKASGTIVSYDNTAYAPINSPTLTGSPVSTTPPLGTSNGRIATASFVAQTIASGQTIGANTTGNAATATNSTQWNGQSFQATGIGTIADYIIGRGSDGVWRPASSSETKVWLGIPSGGETLQSVTARGANTTDPIRIIGADNTIPALGSFGGKFGLLNGTGSGSYGWISGVLNNGDVYQQVQRIDGTATAYGLLLQPNGGNVGIGTSSITSGFKLDVNGAGNFSGKVAAGDLDINVYNPFFGETSRLWYDSSSGSYRVSDGGGGAANLAVDGYITAAYVTTSYIEAATSGGGTTVAHGSVLKNTSTSGAQYSPATVWLSKFNTTEGGFRSYSTTVGTNRNLMFDWYNGSTWATAAAIRNTGVMSLYNTSGFQIALSPALLSADRTAQFPDKDITVAGIDDVNLKANIASPSFTGNASNALLPSSNDHLANKGYVDGLIAGIGTNYVNTTGNQTGIAGNKSWTGNQSITGSVTASTTVQGYEVIAGGFFRTYTGYSQLNEYTDVSISGDNIQGSKFTLSTRRPSISSNALFTSELTANLSSTGSWRVQLPNANGVLALASDLSNYVTLSTNQTIFGQKAFSNYVSVFNTAGFRVYDPSYPTTSISELTMGTDVGYNYGSLELKVRNTTTNVTNIHSIRSSGSITRSITNILPNADGILMVLSSASPPSTSSSAGQSGTVIISGGFRYECIATDRWVRSAVSIF